MMFQVIGIFLLGVAVGAIFGRSYEMSDFRDVHDSNDGAKRDEKLVQPLSGLAREPTEKAGFWQRPTKLNIQ